MSLWVKICANTSLEDARVAADAGADALGFVFAPSPRRVTPAQAAAMVSGLPAGIEKIGVFVDAAFDEIASTVDACGLTGVQLHCGGDETLTARVRARFGPGLRILRVVHFAPDAKIPDDANADGFLIDSRTATAVGGTGVAYDWSLAAATVFQNAEARKRLIAAGGLTPDNVAEAIARLRPWGVDVVSGVEAVPGRKDAAKVRAFVANARAAQNVTPGPKRP
jgi:phosphoribosylanthranilate isomerase